MRAYQRLQCREHDCDHRSQCESARDWSMQLKELRIHNNDVRDT